MAKKTQRKTQKKVIKQTNKKTAKRGITKHQKIHKKRARVVKKYSNKELQQRVDEIDGNTIYSESFVRIAGYDDDKNDFTENNAKQELLEDEEDKDDNDNNDNLQTFSDYNGFENNDEEDEKYNAF